MKTSESIKAIAPAFLQAQKAIQAVKKDKTGKIETKTGRSYEYKYSDLASVIEQVKEALNANGIAFSQTCEPSARGVFVLTTLLHESGEWMEGSTHIPIASDTAQAMGSAITYGKRYGLQSMVGLPSEDDDGKAATDEKPNTVTPDTAKQVAVDAFDALPDDVRTYLEREAIRIVAMHERGENVGDYVARQDYDTEAKLGLWSLLPSQVRSAIKKQTKPRAAELATQP